MDSSPLVSAPLAEGARLIRRLADDSTVSLEVAFWHLSPVAGWRLVLGSPTVDERGPAYVYTEVGKVIREEDLAEAISLASIAVSSPRDPLVMAARTAASAVEYDDGVSVRHLIDESGMPHLALVYPGLSAVRRGKVDARQRPARSSASGLVTTRALGRQSATGRTARGKTSSRGRAR